jgi:hypothetical protein
MKGTTRSRLGAAEGAVGAAAAAVVTAAARKGAISMRFMSGF